MPTLDTILDHLSIKNSTTYQGLTVFPLESGAPPSNGVYQLLDEALRDGTVEITEVSEAGHVPELNLTNSGELPVLLLEGEELIGAKQNRVANVTLLAPAKATTIIPVSCVEAGRWGYSSGGFESSDRAQFARGRAGKCASVSASLRRGGSRRADQHRVWRDVAEKADAMRVESPTLAMSDIYESATSRIDGFVAAFEAAPAQTGALFCIGPEVRGLECFDHPLTLRTLYPKLVRSFALDAIEEAERANDRGPCARDAEAFFERLREASTEQYPALGLGTDIRVHAPALVGGGLLHEERLVHLAVFADPDHPASTPGDSGPGLRRARERRATMRRRGLG